MSLKRNDYIGWDEYFMGIAILSSKRSKDPNTQVGACIVSPDNKIVGIGYNGFPTGVSDDDADISWNRTGNPLDTKYMYVCHAEMNSIMNKIKDVKDCTAYVTLFPCNECTKIFIQSGIKKVIYKEDKYPDSDSVIASKIMLNKVAVIYRQFTSSITEININFLT